MGWIWSFVSWNRTWGSKIIPMDRHIGLFIRIDDFILYFRQTENGEHRYKKGDLFVYVLEGNCARKSLKTRVLGRNQKQGYSCFGLERKSRQGDQVERHCFARNCFPVIDGEVEGIKIPTKINENVADILWYHEICPRNSNWNGRRSVEFVWYSRTNTISNPFRKLQICLILTCLLLQLRKVAWFMHAIWSNSSLHNEELLEKIKTFMFVSKGFGAGTCLQEQWSK